MGIFSDFLGDFKFFSIIETLKNSQFFEYVFPFLLVYAILVTILPRVNIFQNKQGDPFKPAIIIVSLVVSLFGVSFKLPSGYSVGDLMIMMFPNISTLTIGVLALYIVGAILGVDVFKGLFSKSGSAYLYFIIGAIGLGSVVFYTGIVLGFWSYDVYDKLALWNVTLAIGLGILGIVLLLAGNFVLGILLLFVVGTFIAGNQSQSILYSFVDPVIFVVVLVGILLMITTSSTSNEKKRKLAQDLRDAEKTIDKYTKDYGRKPKDFESRIFDIVDENYTKKKREWEKIYGDEKY